MEQSSIFQSYLFSFIYKRSSRFSQNDIKQVEINLFVFCEKSPKYALEKYSSIMYAYSKISRRNEKERSSQK